MSNTLIHRLKIGAIAFTQVMLVAVNTILLTKSNIVGIALSSFLINFIWTHNVKRMAFSGEVDRLIYSTFAMVGCLVGFYVTKMFVN